MSTKHCLCLLILSASVARAAVAQQISALEPQTGTIFGPVTDVNDGIVPGARVALEDPSLPGANAWKRTITVSFDSTTSIREYPTMSPSVPVDSQT